MQINADIVQRVERVLSQLQLQDYTLRATDSGQSIDIVTIRPAPNGTELVFPFPSPCRRCRQGRTRGDVAAHPARNACRY